MEEGESKVSIQRRKTIGSLCATLLLIVIAV